MTAVNGEVLERSGQTETDFHDARADAVRASHQFIDRLIFTDSFHEVCESFGQRGDDGLDRSIRLAYVGRMAGTYLDFRQGLPRAAAPKPNLTDWQETALMKLGDELNMTGISTAFTSPTDVYVTHGSYRPGIDGRLRWTKMHLDEQADRFPGSNPIVMGATSDRPLTEGDGKGPFIYAPYARTERHIMDDGFVHVLKARESITQIGQEGTKYFMLPGGAVGITLSAPKIEGRQLPNTADTHTHAAEILGSHALIGASIVGVTTQVYSLFQEADLRRKLGLVYGADIHMAGFRDPEITQPHHIGQEFNAAIIQASKLYQAIHEQRAGRQGAAV